MKRDCVTKIFLLGLTWKNNSKAQILYRATNIRFYQIRTMERYTLAKNIYSINRRALY